MLHYSILMKEVKIESKLYVFDNIEDTPEEIQNLMQLAIEARKTKTTPPPRGVG